MNELFEMRFRILFESSREKVPSQSKVKTMNECGLKAIEYYK
jgi:DNA-directed RNA polymerase subunit E'/Rpb7